MKIHKLTLKNINSLLGKWEINFDDEAYCQNGIFGIVGNTGAGKTTLLDAICLALYRETPRLGKITESNNALMSIGEMECQAQVELSIHRHQKINRYIFSFSQNRSTRGKNKGNLQKPCHEIFLQDDKGEFRLISEKISESESLAIELLGMDFTQFTRSVLLAQGGFSVFLQADGEKRGQILEKITGTEIYAEIGKKVYQDYKEKEAYLNSQKSKLGDIDIISDDELSQLTLSLDNINHKKSALEVQLKVIEDKLTQKNHHNQLTQDLDNQQKQLNKINDELNDFKPKLERLKKGKSHHELLPIFNHLNSLKNKQIDLKNQAHILQECIHQENSNFIVYQEELVKNKKQFHHHLYYLTQQINDKKNFLTQYRAIKHMSGHDTATHVMNFEHQLERLLQKTHELKQKQAKAVDVREQKLNAKQQLQHKLPSNSDDDICAYLSGLENELRDVGVQLASIDNFIYQFTQWSNKKASFWQKSKTLEQQQNLLQKNEQEFDKQQIVLQQLMNEYELLDKNYRLSDEINRLHDFIEVLTEGNPCPLCGSEHHPYAHNPPMRENTHTLNEQLSQKTAELTQHQNAQKAFELQLMELKTSIIHQQGQLKELDDEMNADKVWLNKEWQSLSIYYHAQNIDELCEEQLYTLKEDFVAINKHKKEVYDCLSGLFEEYQSHEQKEKELLQEWKNIKHEFLTIFEQLLHEKSQLSSILANEYQLVGKFLGKQTDIAMMAMIFDDIEHMWILYEDLKGEHLVQFYQLADNITTQMASFKEVINTVKVQIFSAVDDYQKKYHDYEQANIVLGYYQNQTISYQENFSECGQLNMSDEELFKNLKFYQEILIKDKENLALTEQKIHDLTNRLDDNHQQEKNNQQELASIEHEFNEKLSQKFDDYEDFLRAKLDEVQLNDLENFYQKLIENQKQTQLKIHDAQQQIEHLLNVHHDIVYWLIDDLETSHATLKMELENLLTDFGIKQEKYAQAMQNQQKISALLKEIEQLEGEFLPLRQLNDLIGSSDGKKYRNFAQTLTLRALLAQANVELSKINKRYLLTPSTDDKNTLGIDVIDTYQGDVVRQSKNLSGGESFVVSLALALGLSKMSSQQMQIDSLFLDEGFGTLDEEALELALSALSEIQSDGKMIGVISHIGALKERLHTKISVERKMGGVSVLVGAGVARLD